MESYIVRVYRRFHNSQGDVAGLVETVGSDEKRAFQSFSGLITAIRHAIGHGADPAELRSKPENYPKPESYQDSEADIKKRAG